MIRALNLIHQKKPIKYAYNYTLINNKIPTKISKYMKLRKINL